jgi:hypothetical protein
LRFPATSFPLPLLCLAAVAGIVFGDVRSGDAASVSGVVKMANQPISGAAVTLLAANSGKAIQFGSGTTDSGGNFQVTFQDPPGGVAYLMVDGAGANSPIKLLAMLSNGFPSNVVIDEVTTVAAAFSMAQLCRHKREHFGSLARTEQCWRDRRDSRRYHDWKNVVIALERS